MFLFFRGDFKLRTKLNGFFQAPYRTKQINKRITIVTTTLSGKPNTNHSNNCRNSFFFSSFSVVFLFYICISDIAHFKKTAIKMHITKKLPRMINARWVSVNEFPSGTCSGVVSGFSTTFLRFSSNDFSAESFTRIGFPNTPFTSSATDGTLDRAASDKCRIAWTRKRYVWSRFNSFAWQLGVSPLYICKTNTTIQRIGALHRILQHGGERWVTL